MSRLPRSEWPNRIEVVVRIAFGRVSQQTERLDEFSILDYPGRDLLAVRLGQSPMGKKLIYFALQDSFGSSGPCTLAIGPDVQLTLDQLPDPQWLASLAAASAGRGH